MELGGRFVPKRERWRGHGADKMHHFLRVTRRFLNRIQKSANSHPGTGSLGPHWRYSGKVRPVQFLHARCSSFFLLSSRRQDSAPASPAHAYTGLCPDRRGLGAGFAGQHASADLRHRRTRRSRLVAQLRSRLGYGRVRHAASRDGDAGSAGERAGQDRRAHARDSAADRAEPGARWWI